MPGTIIPMPHLQFLDSNGDPLASGTLETYEAGTSTPLATFSDSALSVTNGTTITLNSAGRPSVSGSEVAIYLLAQAYKLTLKDAAGSTIWTQDNIYALQAASSVNLELEGVAGEALSAGDFAYQSDGSGSLTAGRWYKTDADLVYASVFPVVAFVPTAIASGATGLMRTGGIADNLSGLTAGATQYLSATAGALTETAPANARSVGAASSATVMTLALSPRWVDPVAKVCEGRLTLTTAVPVTTADVSAATTLYFTPYAGNRVALFTGSRWQAYTLSELSITLVGTTASTPYDVFLYDNAGTLTLELLIWTNGTTRATALTTHNGVLVKTGDATRRYLGTIYINSSGGQSDDTDAARFVWNYYHRVQKRVSVLETTDSWTYTLATVRQANAATANKVEVVQGWPEDAIALEVTVSTSNSGANAAAAGIGKDTTTAFTRAQYSGGSATVRSVIAVALVDLPAVGYHYYSWNEYANAAGTQTWYGDDGGAVVDSGLVGRWAC